MVVKCEVCKQLKKIGHCGLQTVEQFSKGVIRT